MDPKTRYENERLAGKESRERAILEAAEQVFTNKGIEKATMQDVANEANVGIATVFRFFPKKDKLILAVATRKMEDVLSDFREIAEFNVPCLKKIELLFDKFSFLERHAQVKLLENFDSYVAHLTEPLEDIESYNSVYQEISHVFASIAEQGAKDGSIRPDVSAQDVLTTIINVFGIFARKLTLLSHIPVARQDFPPERQLTVLKEIFLSYLRNPNQA
ncbi:TetR/AcrR family transcriptional regulator [Cohnella thailandensis]|uniref:TetR/AcrR family transcriptional regulator n=1 Tax=Cohnella thailandensis TaxID=557557 RepID=A0A841SRH2_9BACL|nr:TetR/AcrR family transcriptional regulator [Cohnella thailandensis]MBB6634993.1 TetR/AcrR family transcriptional regulator [Cohnella thailandensis]MBP1975784.1 AcrR family transcriptional regulator [Cohnella thailandensis]